MLKAYTYVLITCSLVTMVSCGGCEPCPEDVVLSGFALTDTAKGYFATTSDTLIFENGVQELILITEKGVVNEIDTVLLNNVCRNFYEGGQYEVLEFEQQSINYFHESGADAFKFGLEIRKQGYQEMGFDSLSIFETFFVNVIIDKTKNLDDNRLIWIHLNDFQYTPINNYFLPQIIADTILNGISYSDIYTSGGEPELYYTINEGVVAFQHLNEMWYLRP